jgi:hypothetical protein
MNASFESARGRPAGQAGPFLCRIIFIMYVFQQVQVHIGA